jgi:hypothetical protein
MHSAEKGQMKKKIVTNLEQYRVVIEDLVKKKNQLQFRIGEIDSAVAALRRVMSVEEISPQKDRDSIGNVGIDNKAGVSQPANVEQGSNWEDWL